MPFLTNATATAALNAVLNAIDAGTTDSAGQIVFYAGTVPADADAALSGNTVLAEVDLQADSFGAPTDAAPGAQATMNGLPLFDLSINATGTVTFARIFDRDNGTVMQLTVGTSGTDIIVNSTAFQVNAAFTIIAFTLTMPES